MNRIPKVQLGRGHMQKEESGGAEVTTPKVERATRSIRDVDITR
jgi:hypothetical protein